MDHTATTIIANFSRAHRHDQPWRHWLMDETVPDGLASAIDGLPFTPPSVGTAQGTRESNNSTRVFFSPEIQAAHAPARHLADALVNPATVGALERMTGAELDGSLLRIEYTMDCGDFWLEPHTDISVKRLTWLLYLSVGEGSDECGTDVLDPGPGHALLGRVPFGLNRSLVFVPAGDTWHGFAPRRINGVRKSLIINYVASDWRSRHELASEVRVRRG